MNSVRSFISIIVSFVAFAGCGSNAGTGESDTTPPPPAVQDNDFVVRWDPPAGHTQLGSVRFVDEWAGGVTVCDLKPYVFTSPAGTAYACKPNLAHGATIHFGIVRDEPRATDGVAWVFDRSCAPWGGCGKDFGTVSLWKGATSVPFTYEAGRAGPPYYNGAVVAP